MISGGARRYVRAGCVDHEAGCQRGVYDSRRHRLGQDHGLQQSATAYAGINR
jgi:hypothetical protein